MSLKRKHSFRLINFDFKCCKNKVIGSCLNFRLLSVPPSNRKYARRNPAPIHETITTNNSCLCLLVLNIEPVRTSQMFYYRKISAPVFVKNPIKFEIVRLNNNVRLRNSPRYETTDLRESNCFVNDSDSASYQTL